MADLTPELLAQLERRATEASSSGRWSGYPSPPPSPAEVLALVAAAKERDQLRAERDLWMRDRDEATAERDAARQLVDKREQERDAAEAEIERLRGLGRGACDWIESTSDKAARRFHAAHLRAEIERKP